MQVKRHEPRGPHYQRVTWIEKALEEQERAAKTVQDFLDEKVASLAEAKPKNAFVGNAEEYRVCVLSTAHITKADSVILADPGLDMPVIPTEFGWLVYLGLDNDGIYPGMSSAFKATYHMAAKQGYMWMNLDCDGPKYDDLTEFDW